MFEVFRDIDSVRVGMFNGILNNAGIKTELRNWNSISMTTEIPIPVMYPNICVYTKEDYVAAKKIIQGIQDDDTSDLPDWNCANCGESNEAEFSECWRCETPHILPD